MQQECKLDWVLSWTLTLYEITEYVELLVFIWGFRLTFSLELLGKKAWAKIVLQLLELDISTLTSQSRIHCRTWFKKCLCFHWNRLKPIVFILWQAWIILQICGTYIEPEIVDWLFLSDNWYSSETFSSCKNSVMLGVFSRGEKITVVSTSLCMFAY